MTAPPGGRGAIGEADDQRKSVKIRLTPVDRIRRFTTESREILGFYGSSGLNLLVSGYEFPAVSSSFLGPLNPYSQIVSCRREFWWTSFRVIPIVIPKHEMRVGEAISCVIPIA